MSLAKSYKKVDSLINKAKKERDNKGYRENLGYDSVHKLDEHLSNSGLGYSEKAKVSNYFFRECDKI